ncbi:MAG: hypothetical protein JNK04_13470 [Myxococcales bacterium]|nr:hypothetical protein [Myxococcales bacterium]
MDYSEELAQRYESREATAFVWRPAWGVLVTRMAGHGTAAAARFYISLAQNVIVECGAVQIFHDWSGLKGYDPEARDLMRAFGKTNSDERVLVHYLVGSKILSMAIQTAGLMLRRNFESTTHRTTYDGWIDAAIAAATKASVPPRRGSIVPPDRR